MANETSTLARVRSLAASVVNMYATPLKASHYLELVAPLWASHQLQARVEEVWDETADARTITLKPGRNWRAHRAGQYIRLGVPIEGRRFTRTYSISSTPERPDGCITITVKAIDGGRMSGHLVRNLTPGTYLPIGLPQGEFLLPEAVPVLPLFITAGSGITPVMSMLRTYAHVGNMPDIVHVHYAPHAYDVIFGNELDRFASDHPKHYHLHPIYTRELGAEAEGDRHFTPEQLDELCPDWQRRDVWACGPQSLLDGLADHFEAHGRLRHLHLERFRAPTVDVPDDATGGTVRFITGGETTEVVADAETPLLRVAEDAGLNPPHGCRMGVCHTCDIPLTSGRVRDLRTGDVTDEVDVLIQTCISSAAGDCELTY